MSEMVILYSSYPLSGKEFNMAMEAVGEGYIEGEGSQFTGAMWDGERAIFLYGDWGAPDPEQFWEKELRHEKQLPEIEVKLGARPVTSFGLEIGKVYGSGLLAVELAYQCALRWPCVVWANTWDPVEGDYISTVYTREDMAHMREKEEYLLPLYLSCLMMRKREIYLLFGKHSLTTRNVDSIDDMEWVLL